MAIGTKQGTPRPLTDPTGADHDDLQQGLVAPSRLGRTITRASHRIRIIAQPLWADWRRGIAVGVATAGVWGLASSLVTPRGPVTSEQALWSMTISLAVGVIGGFVSRSRWAMLATPAVFAASFELVRSAQGPTVDGFHASTYGVLAFVVGRGFHALVSLAPMALGAAIGTGAAATLTQPVSRRGRLFGRATAVLAGLAMVVLAAGLARPASTAPIVDAEGNQAAGSIAELTTVDVNGHELAMMIRGHNVENPVLLFLAGGPGGSELGAMRNHLPRLEEYFTVVTWDQRGAGKSYSELDPAESLTLDSYLSDTIAVTDYLRDRFDQGQVFLLGQSWGSTLGVLAVQEHPERYRAFIGTGQMVSQLGTDMIFYEDTSVWAMASGQIDLFTELVNIGPPPYQEMFPYETALSYEHEVYPYNHATNSEGEGGFSENFIVSEYTLVEQVHLLGAFMDTFAVLYPQLQGIDFRETVTEFDVPVFFVQGAYEARGRSELFDEWYPMVNAPIKEMTVLATSGHRPLWEQPNEFVEFMVDTVLAQTQPTRSER